MLVLVLVRAELARALASGQVWEAPGQARVSGWAERPARQRLLQELVARVPLPQQVHISLLFFNCAQLLLDGRADFSLRRSTAMPAWFRSRSRSGIM